MQQNEQMHPQDRRNLLIFAVLSVLIWFGYDYFIARPHALELQKTRQAAEQVAAQATPTQKAMLQDLPRADVIAKTGRVVIDTPAYSGSINLEGARLDDLSLKHYFKTVEDRSFVEMLSPAGSTHPRYVELGWVAQGAIKGLPTAKTLWSIEGANQTLTPQTPVTLAYMDGGLIYRKKISVDDQYGIHVESSVENKSGQSVTLVPYALVTEHGIPEDAQNMGVVHEGPIGYIGEELHERSYKEVAKKKEELVTGSQGWIGLTSKYWLTSVAPANQSEEVRYRFVSSMLAGSTDKQLYQTDITAPAKTVQNGESYSYGLNVFSGPKQLDILESYGESWNLPHFDLAVDFGWFYFLTKPFLIVLNWLYGLVGNFGVAIILFTCVLRIFIYPLANTSYRSFAKLRQVSPEMYEIRHQYKDDKVRLQQELVALYQRNKVNPMAGCLPMLVQIPIFFALYKVLSNTIEMRHAPFFGWIHDLSANDPTSILNLFGLLPWESPEILSFLHIGIWPILMMIGMIIQKNLSPPPEDPLQKKMMALMPYVMTFVMAKFASGLVIYWTINNFLGVIQQALIMRSMGVPIHLFSADADKKKLEQEIEEGPSVHPSLDMIEEELEEALADGHKKPMTPPKPKKKKK